MRNAIKYYYDIEVSELEYKGNNYIFGKYMLKRVQNEINLEIYNYFLSNNLYLHKIIYNRNNQIYTVINEYKYVLYYMEKIPNIDLKLISSFLYEVNTQQNILWYKLWEDKVDYYEKISISLSDINYKNVFPYYIGLSENAIKYYKENNMEVKYSFSHVRINSNYDYYSPDNIIIDGSMRDIAEYIKYAFFNDQLDEYEMNLFLSNLNVTRADYIQLYSRLMFPTYFYDCIELNENINKYISKIIDYENLLCKIYYIIIKKVDIPRIDWLIKKI